MRTKLLLLLMLFTYFGSYAQISNENYGTVINKEIQLPKKNLIIQKATFSKTKSKYRKKYYNSLNYVSNEWETVNSNLIWNHKGDDKYEILIPPMSPNSFYQVEVNYYNENNLIEVYKIIHQEGNTDWFTKPFKWKKLIKHINGLETKKNEPLLLTYRPSMNEVKIFHKALSNIDLTNISSDATVYNNVKVSLLNAFQNLNFDDVTLDKDHVIQYASYVKANDINLMDDKGYFIVLDKFMDHFNCIDYIGIYNFYNQYLKYYLENEVFNAKTYVDLVKKSIEIERNYYSTIDDKQLPNHISKISDENQIDGKSTNFSTFPVSFEKSYQSALVPDFGFIVYDNFNNNLSGGSPFLGVNISIKPSNKQVPMQISKLDIFQRISIHTGIILNSIKEEKKREDLFSTNSLLLGIGYKIFNHAYRINCGTVIYKKIDPITSSKTFAFAPYIGISIDIEIKKWLKEFIPNLK